MQADKIKVLKNILAIALCPIKLNGGISRLTQINWFPYGFKLETIGVIGWAAQSMELKLKVFKQEYASPKFPTNGIFVLALAVVSFIIS